MRHGKRTSGFAAPLLLLATTLGAIGCTAPEEGSDATQEISAAAPLDSGLLLALAVLGKDDQG